MEWHDGKPGVREMLHAGSVVGGTFTPEVNLDIAAWFMVPGGVKRIFWRTAERAPSEAEITRLWEQATAWSAAHMLGAGGTC